VEFQFLHSGKYVRKITLKLLRHLSHPICLKFQEEDSQAIKVILGIVSATSLPLLNQELGYLFPIYGNLSLKLQSLQSILVC